MQNETRKLTPLKAWLLFFLILTIGLFALHARGINDEFISDDFDWVLTAEEHVEGSNWLAPFQEGNGGNFYRPLIAFGFQIDYALFGFSQVGYHVHQTIFHILLVVGIAFILYQLTKKQWVTFLIAGLFAVYPNQHEVVTWLGGRPDLYAATFAVWSAGLFLFFLQKKNWFAYAGSILLALAAYISKETSFVLPALILLLALLFESTTRSQKIRNLLLTLPWWIGLAVILFVRDNVLSDAIGGYLAAGEREGLNLSTGEPRHVILAPLNVLNWNYLLELTQNNFVIRGLNRIWQFIQNIWPVITLLFLGFILWIGRLRNIEIRKWILFAFSWILIGFVPVYALTHEISTTRLTASRLFFFALIGYALLLGVLIVNTERRKKITQWILGGAIFFCAGIWMLNSIPWHTASRHVATVKKAIAQETGSETFTDTQYIVFQNLPDIVHGAYAFFGPHAIRGILEENGQGEKTVFNANERPYANSPFCSCALKDTLVYTWNPATESLEKNQNALPKDVTQNSCSGDSYSWDMTSPSDAKKWKIHGFEGMQTSEGVELVIPEKSNGYISLENLDIKGFIPQTLQIEFEILESSRDTERQAILAWANEDGYSVRRQLGVEYKKNATQVLIPLCEYINWSTSGSISELRLRPVTGATILLKSISFSS